MERRREKHCEEEEEKQGKLTVLLFFGGVSALKRLTKRGKECLHQYSTSCPDPGGFLLMLYR